jgi:hypothetical protein
MISKGLVARLGLEPLRRKIIVKAFMHTEAIDREFVVIRLLKEDGTVALVRAYIVDSITETTKDKVPEEIRKEFSESAQWPKDRYYGKIGILLGTKELAIQTKRLEIVGNLGIFKSPLSATTIPGGRHESTNPAQMELSQACMMIRRTAASIAQKSFRTKQMDNQFQQGDITGDSIPES